MNVKDIHNNLKLVLSDLEKKRGNDVRIKITYRNGLIYSSYKEKVMQVENIDELLQPVISSIFATLKPLEKLAASIFIEKHKDTLKAKLLEIFQCEAKNNMIPVNSFAVFIHDKETPKMSCYNGVEKLNDINLSKYFN